MFRIHFGIINDMRNNSDFCQDWKTCEGRQRPRVHRVEEKGSRLLVQLERQHHEHALVGTWHLTYLHSLTISLWAYFNDNILQRLVYTIFLTDDIWLSLVKIKEDSHGHDIVGGGWHPRVFSFHHRNLKHPGKLWTKAASDVRYQFCNDLRLFLSAEEAGKEPSSKDIVDVLQETLSIASIGPKWWHEFQPLLWCPGLWRGRWCLCLQQNSFDLGQTHFTCHSRCAEQILQVLQKVGGVVRPARSMDFISDISNPTSSGLSGRFCSQQWRRQVWSSFVFHCLLHRPKDGGLECENYALVCYQHHVSSWVSDDPRYLYQVDYCVWEEDKVHACPSQDLVVLKRFISIDLS